MASSEQWARAEGDARIQQFVVSGDYYAGAGRGQVSPRALPQAPEALVGREDELGEVLAALEPGSGQRAVVVAGLAGVGKSALAVTAAERALGLGWFTGGVLFLSLRGYDPSGAVGSGQAVGTLLEGLGVPAAELPATPDGQLARYRSELAARAGEGCRVLVVADDAGDAAQVRDLVPPGGDVHRLLVTSRDRLVAPDFGARVLDLEVLGADAAGELIADVLRRVRPDDPRPGAEPSALAEVAGHCGWLPLALGVAAAVLAGDPGLRAAELARRLADARTRLEALSPRDRAGLPTGVRAAFGLSYARLPEEQQRMLRLLTVVPGPDCHTAVAAVAREHGGEDEDLSEVIARTRVSLAGLAGAGFLTEQPTGSERWRMHDLVRLYADELAAACAESDARQSAVDRVLGFYSRMTRGAYAHIHPQPDIPEAEYFEDEEEALHWLDGERASLLALVPACAALGWAEGTIGFAAHLCAYLTRRRLLDEAVHVMRIAVDEARRIGRRDVEHRLMSGLSVVLWQSSGSSEAIELADRVAAFYDGQGDGPDKAAALVNLAHLRLNAGQLEEAHDTSLRAIELLRTLGRREDAAEALGNLGRLFAGLGRAEEAVAALEESVAALSVDGQSLRRARALAHLGAALRTAGRTTDAASRYREAVAMFRCIGEWREEGDAAHRLGLLLREQGRDVEAATVLREAGRAAGAAGDHDWQGIRLTSAGQLLLESSDLPGAVEAFEEALQWRRYGRRLVWPAEALYGLGTAYHRMGDFFRAMGAHLDASLVFQRLSLPDREALADQAFYEALRESRRRRGLRGWWRRLRGPFRRR
ncbi:tetratricopeptide repeat protein [Streptomyces sp. NPDC004126]|uniref:tetratricopeptide repeat protein n=1 Tax=Streptomyces sp. NPDC004126 TaxID=3390695 RepID=UPI003D059A6D